MFFINTLYVCYNEDQLFTKNQSSHCTDEIYRGESIIF